MDRPGTQSPTLTFFAVHQEALWRFPERSQTSLPSWDFSSYQVLSDAYETVRHRLSVPVQDRFFQAMHQTPRCTLVMLYCVSYLVLPSRRLPSCENNPF